MKSKTIFGLLAFLLVIFISLLFIPDDKPLKIISSPKIYSILRSSELEAFKIEFLVNKNDTYHFNKEYISSVSLNSELDEEIISLTINDISFGNGTYTYANEEYYLVEFKLKIGFNTDDYLIDFNKTYLSIEYNNSEELKLFIGEFNYVFNDDINNEISVSNLSSTVFEIDGINTVSGIYIELNNISNENLIINRFSLGSNTIEFNNYFLSEIYVEPDLFTEVKEILLVDEYNYKSSSNIIEQTILLRENQSITLYVPLNYIGDIDYIHRFYFEIEYENNLGKNSLIIDDFPYISTSNFQENLEDEYIIYEIPN
ncbi:MAG: hypothetical protein KQ78_01628 [Candidatus Izimaplasma bacterium HR2]|nr:MAG: hypothetical protein KQ78_01628 [Candidatus Izimaplasma bacterium HR2]